VVSWPGDPAKASGKAAQSRAKRCAVSGDISPVEAITSAIAPPA
jgi:hypothetical protein